MKTPRILFFQTPRIWLSLLCTSAMLLTACGGTGGGGEGANGVSGSGLGVSNISVNGQLVPASANPQTVTSGSDDAALINSQRATAPKTLETISFALGTSNANARSVKWQFGSDASDLVGGQLTKTAVFSNGVIPSVTVAFKTASIKTVTSTVYSTADASGTPLSTETIRMYVAGATVIKTASITGAISGDISISSGGQTADTSLTLIGAYSSDLETDYSVQVFDGKLLGTAILTPASNTWSYTANNLSPGAHTFTAKVVRTADTLAGKPSGEYKVSVGNKVTVSNSNPNIWDEFTLTLSNVWSNLTSVVFKYSENVFDMADGIKTQTVNLVTKTPDSVTTAFKTTGTKNITADFKVGGSTVSTRSIDITVGSASVTQTVTITDVKDDTTSIPVNGSTSNAKPIISGSFTTPLSKYYSLKLYDNGTLMSDTNAPTYTLDGNGNKSAWSFKPASAFSAGSHAITAKVVRTDGAEGAPSLARTLQVNKYSQVAKTNVSDFYNITDCVSDKSTGFMWEGKPAPNSGVKRGGIDPNRQFTNFDGDPSNGNAKGYVNAVNSGAGLCGFKDWRLPTKEELSGIVDQTVKSGAKVDAYWFPNTQSASYYWTSSPDVRDSSFAWVVYFNDGYVGSNGSRISGSGNVRLVRNTQKFSNVPNLAVPGVSYAITECVKDNNTGFIWEGKPAGITGNLRGGLEANGQYTNVNGTANTNALGYVTAVNSGAGLCGFKDWRLPTKEELSGIIDQTRESIPKVDVNWFPNTQSPVYWTSSLDSGFPSFAYNVNFSYGIVASYVRNINSYVRLVRDTQKNSQVAKVGGGVYEKTECVKDNNTGLVWEGKPGADTTRGSPAALNTSGLYTNNLEDLSITNAQGYLKAVNTEGLCGFKDWRLPTKEELSGIVDLTVKSGAKADAYWFPNTKSDFYWTSSPYGNYSNSAWSISFGNVSYSNGSGLTDRGNTYPVRLVHD